MATTVYEVAGRNKKAAALLAVLREAGVSSTVAREASEEDWVLAAEAAQVRAPSETTRALVIERLEAFEVPRPKIYVGRCEICEKDIWSDESNTSSFGKWFYHTKCWNDVHATGAGWPR